MGTDASDGPLPLQFPQVPHLHPWGPWVTSAQAQCSLERSVKATVPDCRPVEQKLGFAVAQGSNSNCNHNLSNIYFALVMGQKLF